MLTDKQIINALRANPRIPAPSQTVCRILSLTRKPDCEIAKVASLVATDAGLTAQLLREVNSAANAARVATSSALQACSRLGIKRIRSAVINQHVVSGLGKCCPRGFDANRHYQSALATSVAAQDLCRTILPDKVEDAGTAGLLCDIGIGLMAFGIPTEYKLVLDERAKPDASELHRIEQRVLRLTHGDAGAAVLSDWGLDAHILQGVQHHHREVKEVDLLELPIFPRAIAAAATIARIALDGSDMELVDRLFAQVAAVTPNSDQVVGRMLDVLVANIQETAQTFAIELGSIENLEANLSGLMKDLEFVAQKA